MPELFWNLGRASRQISVASIARAAVCYGKGGKGLRASDKPREAHVVITHSGYRLAPVARSLRVVEALSRSQRDDFVRLPWRIYRDDPHWVPPLLVERKAFINPQKHPFYQHGAATLFVAYWGAEPVGRILVSDDPRFNAQHGTNVGGFGMWESIDDAEVTHSLLDAAEGWLRGRGRTGMLGPMDYSTNYSCGLLVDGFNTPPRVMMNHNPPYYEELLTSWGLTKAKDLYAWWFTDNTRIEAWRPRVERLVRRSGVKIRYMRRDDVFQEIQTCKRLYNEAWNENWGFVPMSDAEFDDMARLLKHLAVAEMLLVAEVNGEAVGFSITLPDFNEAIGPLNGRLTRFGLPIGLLRLRTNLKRIKTARLIALGVLPEFRRRGIAEMLILRTFDYGRDQLGYTGAELSWTLEDNQLINRTIEAVGGTRYKTYRMFEKAIA
ncbi:MAG TPA: GNAT family N-acetyltransferase [Pirellulales bacterium]|nr:GNAT family N-acetyltransferase [Pirellulales bacterium]